jgi:ABC-type phosphonate transport system ATPase subunit
MRRKLDLAASIIVAPDLLFLDEPTTGLDLRGGGRDTETGHRGLRHEVLPEVAEPASEILPSAFATGRCPG